MLEPALLSACCALFGAAIVSDLGGRWIPDSIPLALLLLFALYALTGGHLASVWTHIAIGAVLLLVGFALFAFGGLGGGDGKLMAVAGLWVGPHDLTFFLIGLGLLSLCLALFALLPFERTRRLRANLPFAVAIAPPAIVLLALRAFSV
ncbi:MAG: prepilin peptidase [Desulfurellaceae bacterium]|nr:prepilin peptidase [Desulfurellaceae bacterium]